MSVSGSCLLLEPLYIHVAPTTNKNQYAFQRTKAQKCGLVRLCDFVLKGNRGKSPLVAGINTACNREREGMLLICPARGKLLRRVGQYLAANVRMSCGGRQKTTFSALLLLQWEVMVGGADFHLSQRGLLP